MLLIVPGAPASAGQPAWAHQAPGFQSNGAVTVKSLAGGSYAGTQNPTGALAKANQNASITPPTVIIQATAGGFFNFGSDCFLITSSIGAKYLGVGKMVGSVFTGLASIQTGAGANVILGYAIGVMPPVSSGALTYRGKTALENIGGGEYGLVQGETILASSKCYP